jgi:hypothetical protein
MIDIVFEYSKKWRFEVNHRKTEVVWFGRKGKDRESVFWLGSNSQNKVMINVVPSYVYLGVEVKGNRSWAAFKAKNIRKAHRCMSRSWGMGIQSGALSTKAATNVWYSLIRPVLEYGAEVAEYGRDGRWEEAEKVQRRMARRILGCATNTSNEAVLGELGWSSLEARRDELRLRYWGKMMRMKNERWTKRVYEKSRKEYEKGSKNWCTHTHHLLQELGLEEEWNTQDTGEKAVWESKVREAIKSREEELWLEAVSSKPKMRVYKVLKSGTGMEGYLMKCQLSTGRKLMTAMRTGTNMLRVETGRHWNPKLPLEDRICWCCGDGVEDEAHFMLRCDHYAEERAQLFGALTVLLGATEHRWAGVARLQPETMLKILLGRGAQHKQEDVWRSVQRFLVRATKRRAAFLASAGI